jgi:hypothetical protein
MKTNTVQLHKKVKYLLDQPHSPRFRTGTIDDAINDAIERIVMNRFIPEQSQEGNRGFQRNRVIRDELRPFVQRTSTSARDWKGMSPNGDVEYLFRQYHYYQIIAFDTHDAVDVLALQAIGAPTVLVESTLTLVLNQEFMANSDADIEFTGSGMTFIQSVPTIRYHEQEKMLIGASLPEEYGYYALLRLTINGVKVDPFEITYEQLAMVMQDPFMRPSIDFPPRTYHFESKDGFKFIYGDRGVVTDVELFYLSRPLRVKYGKERLLSSLSQGTDVILGQEEAVIVAGGVTYEYSYGDEFTVPASITSGSDASVVVGTVNSDLPETLVREVVSEAAKILLVTVEKFDKAQHTK